MKITTFTNPTINNNSIFTTNKKSFRDFTDYSALLDDIIADNIIATNPYLKKAKDDALIDAMTDEINSKYTFGGLKEDELFIFAANYLATLGKIKLPYTLGHTYFFNNIPIIFHLDSIEINGEEYFYDDFSDLSTLILPKKTKKTIIDIYTKGNTKINIHIKK